MMSSQSLRDRDNGNFPPAWFPPTQDWYTPLAAAGVSPTAHSGAPVSASAAAPDAAAAAEGAAEGNPSLTRGSAVAGLGSSPAKKMQRGDDEVVGEQEI
eukprot:7864499-Pyramimonas_sp.AAC.1